MAIEILIGVLVAVLAAGTTVAALIGLAGLAGVARLIRCEHCNRLGLTSGSQPLMSCMNCRHERVLHPLAVRHRHWSDGTVDAHSPRHA